MILGVGSDLTDIRRVEDVYARYSKKFLARLFTPMEQEKALRRSSAGPTLAKRFAAKEACAKALGTGMAQGVFWKDMGVVNLPTGQPTMALTGGALKRLQAITPAGMQAKIHLSLSDDYPYAQAFVVISAEAL